MKILNTLTLKSNRQIKINFDESDLSSGARLIISWNSSYTQYLDSAK